MTIGARIRSAISSMFNATWSSVGGFLGIGAYSATDPRRKILPTGMRPVTATANQILTQNLPLLRAHCRHLERNNPTARAAVEALVACVVGSGIGLEPDTGDPDIDKRIRDEWLKYIADCAINGDHDIYYLQCQAFREVVTAGEFIWRLCTVPELATAGKIPLAILPLEAEWLETEAISVGHANADGFTWVGGVGVDKYGRPKAYRLRNPEMIGSLSETVLASEIIHDFERRRALQARGEPWFAPVIEVMQQERDLVDAELKAAVTTASMALVVTSDFHEGLDTTENGTAADPAQSLRLGGVARMGPGDKVEAFSHNRPGQQIAQFRQMLRGDIAGAMRIAQRYLDRDVGRANYSSMRCDMLDTEKLLSPVREWFGHATIGRIYKAVLPYLAIRAGIKKPKATYRLIPDGQPYVDPLKDAQAALLAIGGNLSTFEAEIGKKGGDSRAIFKQAAKEKSELEKLGLTPDLTGKGLPPEPSDQVAPAPAPATELIEPAPKKPRSERSISDEHEDAIPPTKKFTRDENGRLIGVEYGNETLTAERDHLGRLLQVHVQ